MLQHAEISFGVRKTDPYSSCFLLLVCLGTQGGSRKYRGVFLSNMSQRHCCEILAAAVGIC